MGSALLNTIEDPVVAEVAGESATGAGRPDVGDAGPTRVASADALRQQVAERLAAHRRRRAGAQTESRLDLSPETPRPAKTRSARIAAAVAERYAHTPSYRTFLAAEAERAIQQAHAAAEVAALNAQAVVVAQQRLLDEFDEAAMDLAVRENVPNGGADALHGESQEGSGVALDLWPDLGPGEALAGASAVRTSERADTPRERVPQGRPGVKTPGYQSHRKQRVYGTGERVPLSKTWLSAAYEAAAPASASLQAPAGLTVRLYEDAASAAHVYLGASRRGAIAGRANHYEERNEAEARALDEEIAFRQAPVFEEPAGPPVPLPANLIEFPRQLIASRKARPRYAEGPLRDEAAAAPGDGQLRIFEVDPAQISTSPAADSDTAATPQWTAIWLDTPPEAAEMADDVDHARALDSYADALGSGAEDSIADPRGRAVPQLYVATMGRRAMAAAINGAIVLVGLLAFAATFVAISDRSIPWRTGASLHVILGQMAKWLAGQTGLPLNLIAVTGAVAVAFLVLLYQVLFFWFSEATPGMRCARIALCTFDDENPTRRAIRRRGLAMLLSACPLGLGFLWAALDEDRLTWHDRISRMYQRSY